MMYLYLNFMEIFVYIMVHNLDNHRPTPHTPPTTNPTDIPTTCPTTDTTVSGRTLPENEDLVNENDIRKMYEMFKNEHFEKDSGM